MKITNIEVPDYVNYISEWNELQIPQGHLIMDKTITGCGFTEFFLTNQQNVILCSPRKILLENKSDQHGNEVFYVKNELDKTVKVDHDFNFTRPSIKDFKEELGEELGFVEITEEEELRRKAQILQLKQNISDYIDNCRIGGKVFKILVTYDSLKHVLDVLKQKFPSQIINTFQFVVDEFQSIFSDARFKGNVELDFIEYLQDCQNVCFLSATPMMLQYLEQMDEFKNLPYYKLIWPPDKVVRAKIIRKKIKSVVDECGKIINSYRKGIFPRKIMEDKSIHESKEVVFYVNSVKTICGIVKKFGLTPAETNIICSRDDKNKRKLRQVKHTFGSIPLQNQPHKMFTFCTRTVYIGSDFYSTSAYTVVISDCNINTLSVDISLDLPQILGRQRLSCNVFRNECLLFYKTQKEVITRQRWEKKIDGQKQNSYNISSLFEKGTLGEKETYIIKVKQALIYRYCEDFVSVSSKTGEPCYNKLVELAEWRAWEVSQQDYQDDITVKRILESDYQVESLQHEAKIENEQLRQLLEDFLNLFQEEKWFEKKMKLYCDFLDQYHDIFKTTDLPYIPREFQNYVNLLGTKRVKALKYQKNELENEYMVITSQNQIRTTLISTFKVGQKLLSSEVKTKLQELYDGLGIKKRAKATDLGEYFEVKSCFITRSGKNYRGIELLKIKY